MPPLAQESIPPVEANYGLVVPSEEGLAWVCHEAVTEPGAVRAPRFRRSQSGVWLAALPDLAQGRGGRTLFRSSDACNWADVEGLPAGTQIIDAQFDPDQPTVALAVSNTPDGANGVFRSSDAGESWNAVVPVRTNRVFHSVGFGPGAWATATNPEGTQAYWWHAADGETWAESEVTVGGPFEGAEFKVLTTSSNAVWGRHRPIR